jgi:TRAP-type C4-dicarboxylate transport system permease small subunit
LLSKLEKIGKAFEDALLVLILGSMILLAAVQIFLRNFFDIGFIWTDELLRVLVLWIAVAGAVAASRKDRHISIAILDRYVPATATRWVEVFLDGFTAAVCGLIAWHSALFVYSAYEYGDTLLGDFPAWILQAVMPVGFSLIFWRYLVFITRGIRGVKRVEPVQ